MQADGSFLDALLSEKSTLQGCPWLAQPLGIAPGSGHDPTVQEQVLHRAPCVEPASPSACVSASLSVSLVNIYIKSFFKKEHIAALHICT